MRKTNKAFEQKYMEKLCEQYDKAIEVLRLFFEDYNRRLELKGKKPKKWHEDVPFANNFFDNTTIRFLWEEGDEKELEKLAVIRSIKTALIDAKRYLRREVRC